MYVLMRSKWMRKGTRWYKYDQIVFNNNNNNKSIFLNKREQIIIEKKQQFKPNLYTTVHNIYNKCVTQLEPIIQTNMTNNNSKENEKTIIIIIIINNNNKNEKIIFKTLYKHTKLCHPTPHEWYRQLRSLWDNKVSAVAVIYISMQE